MKASLYIIDYGDASDMEKGIFTINDRRYTYATKRILGCMLMIDRKTMKRAPWIHPEREGLVGVHS